MIFLKALKVYKRGMKFQSAIPCGHWPSSGCRSPCVDWSWRCCSGVSRNGDWACMTAQETFVWPTEERSDGTRQRPGLVIVVVKPFAASP